MRLDRKPPPLSCAAAALRLEAAPAQTRLSPHDTGQLQGEQLG